PSLHTLQSYLRHPALTSRRPPSTYPSALFFLHHPAPTDIYTLSLHDALPILVRKRSRMSLAVNPGNTVAVASSEAVEIMVGPLADRKSTRLNSSHRTISYAVFCLKKKKKKTE